MNTQILPRSVIHIAVLIFTILSWTITAISQVMVLDASEIQTSPSCHFIPDTEGKVLLNGGSFRNIPLLATDDTVTVFPSWPVSRAGQNERGGIYCNLDGDPELEVVYTVGNKVYALNINAQPVPGWPRTLNYPSDGAAAFGDIDGDGTGEVVVTTHVPASFSSGSIYAFEPNGTNVTGFPVTIDGGPVRTPVLSDLDGNNAMEIIISVRRYPDGFVYVYQGNGTLYSGWPARIDYTPGSAVAVGDINGDEVPEIIVESYYSLNVFNTSGTQQPGFPYTPGNNSVFSYSTPVLADLDGDGLREIIFGDHNTNTGNGMIHILKYDGTAFPNWPRPTSYWIYGPPAIGDIDNDDTLDVVVGDQILSATPLNKLYAWNSLTGDELTGFPVTGLNAINTQVILADMDDDYFPELMFDDNTSLGIYQGYNHDGTSMEGWPIGVTGTSFFVNPFAADLDLDGFLDLSGGGYDDTDENTYLYLWNTNQEYHQELSLLPVLQYNTRHNGLYGDYLMVGINESSAPPMSLGETIRVFPVPANDRCYLYFRPDLPGIYKLTLRNLASQVVHTESLHTLAPDLTTVEIRTDQLLSGLYILTLEIKGQVYVKKLPVFHP